MDFRLIFICTGNICRSPSAHAVFRHLLREAGLAHQVVVDSAGLTSYHKGNPPDPRAIEHAQARGYDMSGLKARPFKRDELERFDLVLAMDDGHVQQLQRWVKPGQLARVRLLTDFCRRYRADEVPDPYAGGEEDFALALDLIEDACEGLLDHVRGELATRGL